MSTKLSVISAVCLLFLVACASGTEPDPTEGLVERSVIATPAATTAAPVVDNDVVDHGKYLVELLGCGSCHTQGALFGVPDSDFLLAGSDVGIAYSTPLEVRDPAVVFPPNLTPDRRTGLGRWNTEQISQAIRHGRGRYGAQLNTVMPWWGYARLSDSDVYAIASYLKSIPPIYHEVPLDVEEGEHTSESFVYFGVYERDAGR